MKLGKIHHVGAALRFDHIDQVLIHKPKVNWFEVILEDFLVEGPHHKKLERLRQDYPIVFHSVGLNLGGIDPYEPQLLKKYRNLYQKYQPELISDHLCWSQCQGAYHHDLLPIPKSEEALNNLCHRVDYLQNYFKHSLTLENITSYIDYNNESYSEIQFISHLTQKTDCFLLLDISNLIINHKNRGCDYNIYLENFPKDSVKYVHLSGPSRLDTHYLDSHSQPVSTEDIEVYLSFTKNNGPVPVLIERDADIPRYEEFYQEVAGLKERVNEIF